MAGVLMVYNCENATVKTVTWLTVSSSKMYREKINFLGGITMLLLSFFCFCMLYV